MIDPLFDRVYHKQRYNCVHFLCDAWKLVTGDDLSARSAGVMRAVSDGKGLQRDDTRAFERLPKPESPCIVLMHGRNKSPHVGLFYRHKVLHITEQGVQYMPLAIASIGFDRVRFYR
ncbi:MAG: hypothetical protein VXW65_03615 [Pseudomonadota bacterium]|nr:hypothetical protein [Pseudomonadota bacterium]